MADVTVTASSVTVSSGTASVGTAGATIAPFDAVYLDANDNKIKLAKNDDPVKAENVGLACSPAYPNQRVSYLTEGILGGVTVTPGETYVVSVNAGKVRPVADNTATQYVSYVGYGDTDGKVVLNTLPTGVQKV